MSNNKDRGVRVRQKPYLSKPKYDYVMYDLDSQRPCKQIGPITSPNPQNFSQQNTF